MLCFMLSNFSCALHVSNNIAKLFCRRFLFHVVLIYHIVQCIRWVLPTPQQQMFLFLFCAEDICFCFQIYLIVQRIRWVLPTPPQQVGSTSTSRGTSFSSQTPTRERWTCPIIVVRSLFNVVQNLAKFELSNSLTLAGISAEAGWVTNQDNQQKGLQVLSSSSLLPKPSQILLEYLWPENRFIYFESKFNKQS